MKHSLGLRSALWLSLATAGFSMPALAQEWAPSKTVRIVVPRRPGASKAAPA